MEEAQFGALDEHLAGAGLVRKSLIQRARDEVAAAVHALVDRPHKSAPETRQLWLVTHGDNWWVEHQPHLLKKALAAGAHAEELVHTAVADGLEKLGDSFAKRFTVPFDQERVKDCAGATDQGLRVITNGAVQLFPAAFLAPGAAPAEAELQAAGVDAPRTERRRNRILLLVHGTFSNTASLLANFTGGGEPLVAQFAAEYRAVIGFTHFTVSVPPEVNARLIRQAVEQLLPLYAISPEWQGELPEIDIICHSRGGLVTRWLLERSPDFAVQARVRRVLFVATPSAGTNLAYPDNYGRLGGLLGKLGTISHLAPAWVGPVIKLLLNVLLYKAEAEVPGVSSMEPGGPWLAQNLYGQTRPDTVQYYSVSGSFAPERILSPETPKELFYNMIFHVANDLVVDTESVTGKTVINGKEAVGARLDLAGVLLVTDGSQRMEELRSKIQQDLPHCKTFEFVLEKDVDHSGYFRTVPFNRYVNSVLLGA